MDKKKIMKKVATGLGAFGLFAGGGFAGAKLVNDAVQKNHADFEKRMEQLSKDNIYNFELEMNQLFEELLADNKENISKNELIRVNTQLKTLINNNIKDEDNPTAEELNKLFDEVEALKEDVLANDKVTPEDKKISEDYLNSTLKGIFEQSMIRSVDNASNCQYLKTSMTSNDYGAISYLDMNNYESIAVYSDFDTKHVEYSYNAHLEEAIKTNDEYEVQVYDFPHNKELEGIINNYSIDFVEMLTEGFHEQGVDVSISYDAGTYTVVKEQDGNIAEYAISIEGGKFKEVNISSNVESYNGNIKIDSVSELEYEQAKTQVLNMIEQAKANVNDPSHEDTMWK